MEIKIRNNKDFYAGLLFIFFGIFAMLLSRNYPIGNAANMGSGYFPFSLGGILTFLGIIIAAQTLWRKGEKTESWAFRPLLQVLGAVLAFAFTIKPLGLLLATMLVVGISCLTGSRFRIREVAVLYLVLAALAIGIFIYALNLPFKVWPI